MFKKSFKHLKIIDFGLSTRLDVDFYLYPKCGTPGYVAPEIANLVDYKTKYDKICDLFSIGVILYNMFEINLYLIKNIGLLKRNYSKDKIMRKYFGTIKIA